MTPYYDEDGITVYHGDCREIDAWQTADVLVTDPPYGIGYVAGWRSMDTQIIGEAASNNRSDRVYDTSATEVRDAALDVWGDKPAVVFGSWRAPRPQGTQMRLIWDKMRRSPGGVGVFKHSDEEIYLLNWPNPRGLAGRHGSILAEPSLRGSARPDHPTPKPVGLMTLLLDAAPPGVVADPFMGSGSTLLAALTLGRRAIGIEIEERYCEIAATRLSQGVLPLGA